MNNTMQYKGYIGSVEFSEANDLFFGKVQGIRSLISYEGTNATELVSDFHSAVDEYLSLCESEGHFSIPKICLEHKILGVLFIPCLFSNIKPIIFINPWL